MTKDEKKQLKLLFENSKDRLGMIDFLKNLSCLNNEKKYRKFVSEIRAELEEIFKNLGKLRIELNSIDEHWVDDYGDWPGPLGSFIMKVSFYNQCQVEFRCYVYKMFSVDYDRDGETKRRHMRFTKTVPNTTNKNYLMGRLREFAKEQELIFLR